MTTQHTPADPAAAIEQIRQQLDQINQRLDMIYGAVTRLTESTGLPPKEKPASAAGNPFSATMMMDPASMLDSLRQHAQKAGLTVSPETVDRLKAGLPEEQ